MVGIHPNLVTIDLDYQKPAMCNTKPETSYRVCKMFRVNMKKSFPTISYFNLFTKTLKPSENNFWILCGQRMSMEDPSFVDNFPSLNIHHYRWFSIKHPHIYLLVCVDHQEFPLPCPIAMPHFGRRYFANLGGFGDMAEKNDVPSRDAIFGIYNKQNIAGVSYRRYGR